jgi:hypothetical protein
MRGTAQNWSSGSLALAISNIAWPSVVGRGLPNLGLFRHAIVPSLFPGLSKADALQHISPMFTSHEVSFRNAYLRRNSGRIETKNALSRVMM